MVVVLLAAALAAAPARAAAPQARWSSYAQGLASPGNGVASALGLDFTSPLVVDSFSATMAERLELTPEELAAKPVPEQVEAIQGALSGTTPEREAVRAKAQAAMEARGRAVLLDARRESESETFGLKRPEAVPAGAGTARASFLKPAAPRAEARNLELPAAKPQLERDPKFWPAYEKLLAEHPGRTGVYSLEKGEESLLARAWLSQQAAKSIDVQYFIWSVDNVGILAAQRLLLAAENGVKVRVIVDDLLVDASPEGLVALAAHPNIEIKIYNPRHSVGVSTLKRVLNVLTDFRGANQRMHDKVFLVDGKIGIVGGRNMANEYYDHNTEYNFRDRDLLLMGPTAEDMGAHFETFWSNPLAVPVKELLKDRIAALTPERIAAEYDSLHRYAADPKNFPEGARRSLEALPRRFAELVQETSWEEDVRFIGDKPGKNDSGGLGGGGASTSELIKAVGAAKDRVVIQSPYLVLSDYGLGFFEELAKKAKVRIVTNSLPSTDNLFAYSGYSKIRAKLLSFGVKVFEFKPHPAVHQEIIDRGAAFGDKPPVFSVHAKTVVIDGETVYIGTFNLDPRSANLNTEVGVIVRSKALARKVEAAIERDMRPENSWDAATGEGQDSASLGKRLKMTFFKLLPLQAVL